MAEELWRRDEIESPCVRICQIHPGAGLCVGCLRSAEEIARWSTMAPAERRAIMDGLAARAPRLTDRAARPSRRRAREGHAREG